MQRVVNVFLSPIDLLLTTEILTGSHMSSFRLRHMCPQNLERQLVSQEFDFVARQLLLLSKSFHSGSFVCGFIYSVLQSWPLLRCQ